MKGMYRNPNASLFTLALSNLWWGFVFCFFVLMSLSYCIAGSSKPLTQDVEPTKWPTKPAEAVSLTPKAKTREEGRHIGKHRCEPLPTSHHRGRQSGSLAKCMLSVCAFIMELLWITDREN